MPASPPSRWTSSIRYRAGPPGSDFPASPSPPQRRHAGISDQAVTPSCFETHKCPVGGSDGAGLVPYSAILLSMSGVEDLTQIAGIKPRALRGDAARNVRRILDAARAMLGENPQASADDIARAAGLGVATLYRRFPTREDLIRGVIWDIFATDIAPALDKAENEPDPRDGVRIAFEAALRSSSSLGTPVPVGMTLEIAQSFLGPVSQLICQAQEQGLMRADLDPEKDTLRILLMLLSVTPTFRPGSEGWNRYLRLVMDSLELTPAEPLPPAEAIIDPFQRGK